MPDDSSLPGILGGAGGLTAIAVFVGVYQRFFQRKDEQAEREHKERDAVRASLDERQLREMDRLERTVERERGRNDGLETQRDAAEDQARGWRDRCHGVGHQLNNARLLADDAREKAGLPPITWSDESLPALEDIIADNARRRASEVKPAE